MPDDQTNPASPAGPQPHDSHAEQPSQPGAERPSQSGAEPLSQPVAETDAALRAEPSADQVKAALRKVKDPELNLNVVDLGLIYDVTVDGRNVKVDMSLTSPACPSGAELTTGVEQAARSVDGVEDVSVNIVWEPMWTPDRIEPRIRTYLGF